MKPFKEIFLLIGLASIFAIVVGFQNIKKQNTIKNLQKNDERKGFAVVELFTSEGCWSCPPADELIEKLQKGNNNKQLYIMAFHVDYWDHQGWKDRFSKPEFTLRQQQYASWLNLNTIYTPQIVVNGTTELIGSDESAVLSSISSELKKTSSDTFVLHAEVKSKNIQVTYSDVRSHKEYQIIIALVQKSALSKVKAGENAGKNLSHVQIVRELYQQELVSENNISIDLPNDFNKEDWELIGFVQNKSNGKITQATRFEFDNNVYAN
ncbi:Protein of unknown function [Chitinophaga sp. CF118]|uniref:DUF1223 domain-containing protein n=1 Tax=Chitinophaga sp. CF118 TaxID=1884367 RepID=UPI0008E4480C|nr:DUF1223 domain-containing protein [Chitinophaga sp. CF118]SFD97931.1 Protein of unknown function [Chitinophaga sp. CF118]